MLVPMKRRNYPANKQSLSARDRAYQHIQRAVADGVLGAGSGVSELRLAKELGSSRTPIREAMQLGLTGNSRILKIVNETRLLIRIFAMQRGGHDASELESIQQDHQRVLDAVANQDPSAAMAALSDHIQLSERERINDFDQWNREVAMRSNISMIFDLQDMVGLR